MYARIFGGTDTSQNSAKSVAYHSIADFQLSEPTTVVISGISRLIKVCISLR